MLSQPIKSFATALALLSMASAAPTGSSGLSQTAQLQLADTGIDRYSLLKDEDFIFDFNKAPFPLANRKFFPALTGTNLAIAPAVFPPCSIAALHIHPRSAEIFLVLSGRVMTEMVPETGAVDPRDGNRPRVIRTELTGNQTTVFPQGSLHMQMNPECTPAHVVAAFSSDDPGATLIVPGVFSLDEELTVDSFGGALSGEDVERIKGVIPQGAIFEVEECRKKCGQQ
ncbi:RmlC-like cupin domain-containing protein [Cladorrhinum sp. PSN259]|nr:RmlC-like cupin domain-containing protein [Cladorrhinum sp. PSN259]